MFHNVGQVVGRRFVGAREQIEEVLIESYEIPSDACSVSVSIDRVSVPMQEPRKRAVGRPRKDAAKRAIVVSYRMADCGTVTLPDAGGEGIHTVPDGARAGGHAQQSYMGMADELLRLAPRRPPMPLHHVG